MNYNVIVSGNVVSLAGTLLSADESGFTFKYKPPRSSKEQVVVIPSNRALVITQEYAEFTDDNPEFFKQPSLDTTLTDLVPFEHNSGMQCGKDEEGNIVYFATARARISIDPEEMEPPKRVKKKVVKKEKKIQKPKKGK